MAIFSVVILTAPPTGQGNESGGAFVKIDGREALLRTVELFLNRDNVKQIQLVVLPDAMEEVKRKYGGHLGFSGVKLVAAGPRWVDQIAAVAEKVSPESSHVIVHDAARPVVAAADIDALMEAAEKRPIVALSAALRNTLFEVDEGGDPMAAHPAGRFVMALWPQAYSREKFLETARTKAEPHPSGITLVKGSALNMRIGSAADASLAKAMLNLLPKPKIKAMNSPFEEAQW